MAKIHMIQAEAGDAFLLEVGKKGAERFVLIDGGPAGCFPSHIRDALKEARAKTLELVVVSLVDTDHIGGILELMGAVHQHEVEGTTPDVTVKAIWHNAFSAAAGPKSEGLLMSALAVAPNSTDLLEADNRLAAIQDGSRLSGMATVMKIPVNQGFKGGVISADDPKSALKIGDARIQVAGPTAGKLNALRKTWNDWLKAREADISEGRLQPREMADASEANLSSIILWVEVDRKRAVFMGDAPGADLIEWLEKKELLRDGVAHVDFLKVPHHGSKRNVDRAFFDRVQADHYLLSGNGKHSNPELETLEWIVQARRPGPGDLQIYLTNSTANTTKLAQYLPPDEHKYRLHFLPEGEHSLEIPV